MRLGCKERQLRIFILTFGKDFDYNNGVNSPDVLERLARDSCLTNQKIELTYGLKRANVCQGFFLTRKRACESIEKAEGTETKSNWPFDACKRMAVVSIFNSPNHSLHCLSVDTFVGNLYNYMSGSNKLK